VPLLQSTSPSNNATVTPPASRKRAGWWRAPQQVWLRRAIFQLHLWVGVVLASYSVVIGLSGATLVFREQIENRIYAKELNVQDVPRTVTFGAAVKQIAADRPGWVPVGLRYFQTPGRAALVLMRPANDMAATNIRYVHFNPYTGAVVLDRMRYSNFLGWCSNVHYYLLFGRPGLAVSGWMALGLLMLTISGVILWWPGVARWAAALTLQRRSSWRRVNWDLHSVVGFWSSFALLAVTFTGVYFAFPVPVAGSIVIATRGSVREALKFATVPKAPAVKAGTPRLPLDDAIAILNRELRPAPPIEYLQLPVKETDAYGAVSYYPHTMEYTQMRRVAIDPHSGAVLSVADTHNVPLGMHIVQYFHAVHFGTFGGEGVLGIVVKVLWIFVGLTPALLAVTGLLMYWNRKLRPLAMRLRARRA
jgi:uncharacterized iron-regulated membrane protein